MAADTPPPNYFEMLQGFLQPFMQGGAQGGSPAAAFPMLDPKELEKKIGEMETVLLWLKAQSGAVELSIETMKVQLAWLKEWQGQTAAAKKEAPAAPAAFSEAFNPAAWVWNQMPQTAAKPAAAKKPRTSARKKR